MSPISYRSKAAVGLVLGIAMATGCRRDPQVTSRAVTLYAPRACAPDGSAYAELRPLGDFDAPPPPRGHVLGDVGEGLPEIDDAARALLVTVTEGNQSWTGIGDVPAAGAVDVLLWPLLASCPLSTPVDARTGGALAAIAGSRVLVVGGSGNPNPRTFVADLTTGDVSPVGTGLLLSRTLASVTAFGDGGLVAGGVGDDATVLSSAEIYDPALGGFDQQHPIQLGDARADHAAAVLATGETLLVGGVGADGSTPLASMEIVDPVARAVRTEGVARLAIARRAPTAVRLASGEILVAGGLDASGHPVSTLEWIAPDASGATKRTRDLVTGSARSLVALDGGGALAVVAPAASDPPDFQNVWVIDADGALEPGARVAGTLTAPMLFGGAQGAPVLWTGDRWLRWQPWSGSFGALATLDDNAPQIGAAAASPDAGLALWLATDRFALTALRFDVGGDYEPLPQPLLVQDTSNLAPDRLPGPGVLTFDPTSGLTLQSGASAFVADRTYTDVAVDYDAPTGQPATVVLRDTLGNELEVGGDTCAGLVAAGAGAVHVERQGSTVTWSAAGGASGTCPTAPQEGARVSIGVRAPASTGSGAVRNLRVARLGTP